MAINFNITSIIPYNLGACHLKNIGDSDLLLIMNGTNIKIRESNKVLIRIGNISNNLINKLSCFYIKYNILINQVLYAQMRL